MNFNGLAEGFQAGAMMGNTILRARRDAEAFKMAKRDREIKEALMVKDNPGLYLSPSEPGRKVMAEGADGKMVDEVDGMPVREARATPFNANQRIEQLGEGAYYSPDERRDIEKEMIRNKINDQLAIFEGMRNSKKQALKDELGVRDEYAMESEKRAAERQLELLEAQSKMANERGDRESMNRLANEKEILQMKIDAGAFTRPAAKASDANKQYMSQYKAAMDSVKSYQRMLDDENLDPELKDSYMVRLQMAQDAADKAAAASGMVSGDEYDVRLQKRKQANRLKELGDKGEYHDPWFGSPKGRTPDEEKEYQALKSGMGYSPQGVAPEAVQAGQEYFNDPPSIPPQKSTSDESTDKVNPENVDELDSIIDDMRIKQGMKSDIRISGGDILSGVKSLGAGIAGGVKGAYEGTLGRMGGAIGEDYQNAFPRDSEMANAIKLHDEMRKAGIDTTKADESFRWNQGYRPAGYVSLEKMPKMTDRGYIETVNKLLNSNGVARQIAEYRSKAAKYRGENVQKITSEEEYAALPSGSKFEFNGKMGVKP